MTEGFWKTRFLEREREREEILASLKLTNLTAKEPEEQMGVSKNRGTPKSSILIGFSIINYPFWGTTIFGNTQISFWDHLFSG